MWVAPVSQADVWAADIEFAWLAIEHLITRIIEKPGFSIGKQLAYASRASAA